MVLNKRSKILNDMAKVADSSISKKITKNYCIRTKGGRNTRIWVVISNYVTIQFRPS